MKGWKRKCMRRERDGIDFYRSARSTLEARVKRKFTEKSSWYKKKRKREDEEDEESTEKDTTPRKRKRGEERRDAHSEHPVKVTTDAKLAENTENMSAVAVIVDCE